MTYPFTALSFADPSDEVGRPERFVRAEICHSGARDGARLTGDSPECCEGSPRFLVGSANEHDLMRTDSDKG